MNKNDAVMNYLQRLTELDASAVKAVLDNRVPIDPRVLELEADDCPVVVGVNDPERPTLGALGIINGLLETLGIERVTAVYESDGALSGFGWRSDFTPTTPTNRTPVP